MDRSAGERGRLEAFRAIADERIGRMNLAWIRLEQAMDPASTAELQRELHSLKGEASLMGFAVASQVVHALEDALKPAFERRTPPESALGDLVLRGFDLVGALV